MGCSSSTPSRARPNEIVEKLVYQGNSADVYVEAKSNEECNGRILYLPSPIKEELQSLFQDDPRAKTVFTSWGDSVIALVATEELGEQTYPLWLLLENGSVLELNIRLAKEGQRVSNKLQVIIPSEKK